MIIDIDICLEVDTGDRLASVLLSDGTEYGFYRERASREVLFENEVTIQSATVAGLLVLYFDLFDKIMLDNIGNNISRVTWSINALKDMVFERWFHYPSTEYVDGMIVPIYKSLYERIIFNRRVVFSGTDTISRYSTLVENLDYWSILNILPSKFVARGRLNEKTGDE